MKRYKTLEEIAKGITKKANTQLKKKGVQILFNQEEERTTYGSGHFLVTVPGTADIITDTMKTVKGCDMEKLNPFNYTAVYDACKDRRPVEVVGTYNTTPDKKTAHNLIKLSNESGDRVLIAEAYYKMIADYNPTLYAVGKAPEKSPVYFEISDGIYGVILPVSNPGGDVWNDTETTTEEPTTGEEVQTEEEPEATPEGTTDTETTPEELTPESVTKENYKDIAFSLFAFGKKTNPTIILLAGIEADAISCEEFKSYLFKGIFPAVHTFETWKQNGCIVKKGSKAAFTADIWKYTEKHGTMTAEEAEALNKIITNSDGSVYKEGDETTKSKFIIKKSFFFAADQVEKITVKPFTIPEGITQTFEGNKEILSGDTRRHKEAIKAAGYSWNKKASVWYRYTA